MSHPESKPTASEPTQSSGERRAPVPSQHLETLAVHGGFGHTMSFHGAVATPIFQSSTYRHAPDADGRYDAVRYSRLSNGPNHVVLHDKLARMTGHEAALVCASGMAAIAGTLLGLVRPGERIFFQRGLYGGTQILHDQDLPNLGIGCDLATTDDVATWRDAIRPGTRAIYVEAIANPLTTVLDLAAVVALAREIGALAIIDATFASPVNFRPSELGFDVEVHSATKYLNGHSDVIAGVVAGREPLVHKVRLTQNHLGGALDPHACFLLERGLKTLTLRVRQQNAATLGLARYLAGHPHVHAVHYPGLDPERLVPSAVRDRFHGYGGVLSFTTEASRARELMTRLMLATPAPSLGGPETLVTIPATTSHSGVAREARLAMGIEDGLVRVACGLEALDDIVADFAQALA